MRATPLTCWFVAVAVGIGCGGGDGEEDFDCGGMEEGTWRVQFIENSGNCGPIPEGLVSSGSPAPTGCTTHRQVLSADRCQLETDFTCPTEDELGSLHYVAVLRQTSATVLRGPVSVTLTHPAVTCRSVYELIASRM